MDALNMTDMERRFGITEKRAASCERHGEYSSAYIERSGKWTGCAECSMEEQSRLAMEEQRQERERRARQKLDAMMGRAAIPERFEDKDFDSYRAETPDQAQALASCKGYAEDFPARLGDGRCLLLLGNPGTGKTHLSTAIASHVVKHHGMPALYTTITEAIRKFKDNWTTRERAESDIVNLFAEPALLVLDEIGHGWGSDTELNLLFEIINARYQARKPTVLSGNIAKADVRKCLGDRVADRLNEGGGRAVIFNWLSARSSL